MDFEIGGSNKNKDNESSLDKYKGYLIKDVMKFIKKKFRRKEYDTSSDSSSTSSSDSSSSSSSSDSSTSSDSSSSSSSSDDEYEYYGRSQFNKYNTDLYNTFRSYTNIPAPFPSNRIPPPSRTFNLPPNAVPVNISNYPKSRTAEIPKGDPGFDPRKIPSGGEENMKTGGNTTKTQLELGGSLGSEYEKMKITPSNTPHDPRNPKFCQLKKNEIKNLDNQGNKKSLKFKYEDDCVIPTKYKLNVYGGSESKGGVKNQNEAIDIELLNNQLRTLGM